MMASRNSNGQTGVPSIMVPLFLGKGKQMRIRKFGPPGVVRPFTPRPDRRESMDVEEKKLETLEHIATALSAIDHNLEQLVGEFREFAKARSNQ